MAKSLADLETELKLAEAQLVTETDPTQVAVLAGRIIELKAEVVDASGPAQTQPAPAAPAAPAQAASMAVPADFVQEQAPAPAPEPKPASESKPTPTPDVRDAQIAQAARDAQTTRDYEAAAQAAAEAAATGTPAAKADAAAAPAPRTGIDPSKLPIALRPTRN